MRWHILGSGAMGCLWAARLTAGGQDTTLLVRDAASLAALRDQGGVRVSVANETVRTRVSGELVGAGPPIELVLVCVKAHQTLAAVGAVADRLRAGSRLVFLQNGMGQLDEVAAGHPELELYPAVTTEAAWRCKPFCIVHAGRGETWLGPQGGSGRTSPPMELLGSLRASGLALHWDAEIAVRQWRKLAVNCVVNPLTALLGCENGRLLEPAAEGPLTRLCKEVEQVLKGRGVALEAPLWVSVCDVLRATATNRSSMLQDLAAGRRTEVDYITGFLLRHAESLGVAAPANRQLLELIDLKRALSETEPHRRP